MHYKNGIFYTIEGNEILLVSEDTGLMTRFTSPDVATVRDFAIGDSKLYVSSTSKVGSYDLESLSNFELIKSGASSVSGLSASDNRVIWDEWFSPGKRDLFLYDKGTVTRIELLSTQEYTSTIVGNKVIADGHFQPIIVDLETHERTKLPGSDDMSRVAKVIGSVAFFFQENVLTAVNMK